jgi:spore maturation protein CgeB
MLHAYGNPDREHSYEYFNFFETLRHMGHEVELFDYMGEIKTLGKVEMNQKLLARTRSWRPTLILFSLYTDQFEPETIEKLQEYTQTLCFFHDDTWRVEYSRYWARHFSYFSTPDYLGESKYREIGLPNAIYFPFGCNERIFRKLSVPKKVDVSFVGTWHPYRAWIINRIRKAGISVVAAGHRWPRGEIKQEDMVSLFNQSRINLNLSNSASWDARYLTSSARALLNGLRSQKNVEQLKARVFELAGCGAFQLSYYVDGLEKCYEINKEICVYVDPDDLIEKIKFYLAHESLRESIAAAGFSRTLQDHTFERRFNEVFQRMGLADER